jgi:hypothetical protein
MYDAIFWFSVCLGGLGYFWAPEKQKIVNSLIFNELKLFTENKIV